MSGSHYRTDIQGLRGIAVLAVVAYHAQLPVSGGFIGVDVFFVISGFVVAQMLQREIDRDATVSLTDFFSRRIRRLLPIYLFVTLTTIALSIVFLSPFGEQQQAFETARWSSVFVANIQLLLSDTYQALVENPFRHLWSLSVEEQFYLFLPFLFLLSVVVARRSGQPVRAVSGFLVGAISMLSVWICLVWSGHAPGSSLARWAFFSMPSRLWEFGVGIVVSSITSSSFRCRWPIARIVAAGSMVALVATFVIVDDEWRFPGPVTLVPVLATGLILLTSPHDQLVHRVLSWIPVQRLGDLSYGWYLWHWPFVVFGGIVFPGRVAPLVALSVVALVVSHVTYRKIEQPLRQMAWISGTRALLVLFVSIGVIVGVSMLAERGADSGYGLREAGAFDFEFGLDFDLIKRGEDMDGACFLGGLEYAFEDLTLIARGCANGVDAQRTSILLLGDSNALSASAGVFSASEALGFRAVAFSGASCPFLRGVPLDKAISCPPVQDSYRKLVDDLDPQVVVIANRYDLYVGPLAHYVDDDHRLIGSDGVPNPSERKNLAMVAAAMREEVTDLIGKGRKVIVMLQPPPGLLTGRTLFETWFPDFKNADRLGVEDVIDQRMRIRRSMEEVLGDVPDVVLFDPGDRICGRQDFCEALEGDELLYSDLSHLNNAGSLRLSDAFAKMFAELID